MMFHKSTYDISRIYRRAGIYNNVICIVRRRRGHYGIHTGYGAVNDKSWRPIRVLLFKIWLTSRDTETRKLACINLSLYTFIVYAQYPTIVSRRLSRTPVGEFGRERRYRLYLNTSSTVVTHDSSVERSRH